MSRPVRIGNAHGFWGDRIEAAAEMLAAEPDLDYVTLDFLAEVSMSLLAGGGVKGGFVYGSSDRLGMYPETNPVKPADLTATIFNRFGIDPMTEIHDTTGRPHRISDGRPIRELFGA